MGDQVEEELTSRDTIRMAAGKLAELVLSWGGKAWPGQGSDQGKAGRFRMLGLSNSLSQHP